MASRIVTEWYNAEQTVIKKTFKQGWTLEDFLETVRLSNKMIESVSYTVSTITVFEGTMVIPKGFVFSIPSVLNTVPLNEGFSVVVGGGYMVASMARIAMLMGPFNKKRIRLAKTLEEAEDIIREELASQVPSVV